MTDGLMIYKATSVGVYSLYGHTLLFPIDTLHDGVLGETQEVNLFLRNDDATKYYEFISIRPECLTSPDDVIGNESGWGIKLYLGTAQPTEAYWATIDYGTKIYFSEVGSSEESDITTYQSFWYRVEGPAGIRSEVKENIILALYYDEHSI